MSDKPKTQASGEVQILPELQVGKKTTIIMPTGEIDEEGIKVIQKQLWLWDLLSLPDWWDYSTQVKGKGEYVGSFCKRVAKYYWQTHRIKLSSDRLGILGSIMSMHTDKNANYVVDYTQNLHSWDSGDFGDSGSCFWTCNSGARTMLEEDGAWAIRFYKNKLSIEPNNISNHLEGFARAWICRRNNYYVVFNGYGLETVCIARIMANGLNLSYRKITLNNNDELHGLLYINGYGYAIGYESDIHGLSQVDLEIDDNAILCCECEERFDENDAYYHNNQTYCQDCFSENFSYCDNCDEYYPNDQFEQICGRYICDDCRDSNYSLCEKCGEYADNDQIVCINDEEICQDCKDEYYESCKECGEYVLNKDLNANELCDECQEKLDEDSFSVFS